MPSFPVLSFVQVRFQSMFNLGNNLFNSLSTASMEFKRLILRHHSSFLAQLFQFIQASAGACIKIGTVTTAAIAKSIRLLRTDPSFACVRAIEQYMKFVTVVFPMPFVYYYLASSNQEQEKDILMLRPVQGRRKVLTAVIQLFVLFRGCWLLFAISKSITFVHHGLLTSDFCAVIAMFVTALPAIVLWVKTWYHASAFCWLHNSSWKINRGFSGEQSYRIVI